MDACLLLPDWLAGSGLFTALLGGGLVQVRFRSSSGLVCSDVLPCFHGFMLNGAF